MRILQLCNRIPYPPKDGGAIGFYNFIKSYHALGQDLTVLSFNTLKHYWDPNKLPESFTRMADFRTVTVDTDVKPWGALKNLFTNESYNIQRFESPEVRQTLKDLLREKEFDIIHLDSIYVAMYLDTIRENSQARVVFRAHNIEYLIWQRLAEVAKPGPKKLYLQLLARRLKNYETAQFHKFDAILPISEYDKQIIREYSGNVPMYLTQAGVNWESFNPDFNQTEFPTLFHLGSLDWLPNLEAVDWFLEHVWPSIYAQCPQTKFYVAGRNMPDRLKNYKGGNVVMEGEVDDAMAFMNSKAIMVVPLLSGSGMRLKILEGMAMGKCIVSTSIGAEGINCEHGRDIIIADDPDAFIESLNGLLQDSERVFQIGENARALIKNHYVNEKIVEGVLGFYDQLISESVPTSEGA